MIVVARQAAVLVPRCLAAKSSSAELAKISAGTSCELKFKVKFPIGFCSITIRLFAWFESVTYNQDLLTSVAVSQRDFLSFLRSSARAFWNNDSLVASGFVDAIVIGASGVSTSGCGSVTSASVIGSVSASVIATWCVCATASSVVPADVS